MVNDPSMAAGGLNIKNATALQQQHCPRHPVSCHFWGFW